MHEPENLTVAETVTTLRIGRTSLFKFIRSGDIEAFKLGRRTLIKAASARAFISSLPRVHSD